MTILLVLGGASPAPTVFAINLRFREKGACPLFPYIIIYLVNRFFLLLALIFNNNPINIKLVINDVPP